MLSEILEFARSWNSLCGKVTSCLHELRKIPTPPPISCPGCVIHQTVAIAEVIIAHLSPRRPEFDLGEVHVLFVVDRVGIRRVFVYVLRYFPVIIIPSLFDAHSSFICN